MEDLVSYIKFNGTLLIISKPLRRETRWLFISYIPTFLHKKKSRIPHSAGGHGGGRPPARER